MAEDDITPEPTDAELLAIELAKTQEALAEAERRLSDAGTVAEATGAAADTQTVLAMLAEQSVRTTALMEQMAAQAVKSNEVGLQGVSKQQADHELAGTVTAGEPPTGDDILPEPVTFRSRGKNFTAIHKSRHRYTTPTGELVVTDGVHYPFGMNQKFTTNDRRVVAFLKGLASFGIEFWVAGEEPFGVPSMEKTNRAIMQAVRDLNVDRLDEIAQEERELHQRPEVFEMIEQAREMLQVPATVEG